MSGEGSMVYLGEFWDAIHISKTCEAALRQLRRINYPDCCGCRCVRCVLISEISAENRNRSP